jgi:hypothetical protein
MNHGILGIDASTLINRPVTKTVFWTTNTLNFFVVASLRIAKRMHFDAVVLCHELHRNVKKKSKKNANVCENFNQRRFCVNFSRLLHRVSLNKITKCGIEVKFHFSNYPSE